MQEKQSILCTKERKKFARVVAIFILQITLLLIIRKRAAPSFTKEISSADSRPGLRYVAQEKVNDNG